MLFETGRVVAVEHDSLWVETIRRSTCGSCAAQKGCGYGIINRFTADGRRGYVRVLPGAVGTRACAVDDEVRISIPEEVILRGSLVVYMLPLLGMLLGAAAAASLSADSQDLLAAIGAAVGFGLGLSLVRWHAWRHRRDETLQPKLVEVLRPGVHPVGGA